MIEKFDPKVNSLPDAIGSLQSEDEEEIEDDDDEKELNENKIILVKSKKDIINKKIKN